MSNAQDAVDRLIERVRKGEKLTEQEVSSTLARSRDLVLLSIAKKMQDADFEDMSSIEMIDIDKETGMGSKTYSRKDMFRIFNVLQNAVERHNLNNNLGEDPLAAMQAVWQTAMERSQAK